MKVDPHSAYPRFSTRSLCSLFKRCGTCNYLENGNSWIDATSHSGNAGEFWRTWTLNPKFKWEYSRAQSQHLTQLSGKQRCQSVTIGAIRHFSATSNIPQYLQFRDLKCKEKKQQQHFYCCLVLDWKYIKTQEGPRSFRMYQYILPIV